MNAMLMRIILLARTNMFESLRKHSQQSNQMDIGDLWLALAAFGGFVVLLCVLAKLFPSNEKTQTINSPLRLFWALCRVHRIKLSQRWLLWRIARDYELKDPALLFVEPELLDVDMLGKGFAGKAAAINSLHEQLFEGLVENES